MDEQEKCEEVKFVMAKIPSWIVRLLDTFSNVWTGLFSLILLTVPLKVRKKSSKSKPTIRIITDKYMNKCLLINFPKFRIIITCSPHLFYIPIL